MSQKQSPYEILGVERKADAKTIKRAYKVAMSKYHPDKAMALVEEKGTQGTPEGDAVINEARENSSAVNVAYDILSDDEKRQVYDQYGYDGLESLAEGNDPAASGGRRGEYTASDYERAEATFGGNKGPMHGMSAEEVMADNADDLFDLENDTDGVLENARTDTTDALPTLEQLIAEQNGQKSEPKTEKTPDESNGGGFDFGSAINGIFNTAKTTATKAAETAQGMMSNDNSELASRLQNVIISLANSEGQQEPDLLEAMLIELDDIKTNIEGSNKKQDLKNRFGSKP